MLHHAVVLIPPRLRHEARRRARPHRARLHRARPHRRRHGSALVECLVAMLLLASGALALAAGTRATALLADDAILVARAQALSTTSAERTWLTPCFARDGPSTTTLPRVQLITTARSDSGLRVAQLVAKLSFTPFARITPATLTASSARACR